MGKRPLQFKHFRTCLLAVTPLFIAIPAGAQSTAGQDNRAVQTDITRRDVTEFNQFLDSHREISEQLRKDPNLIDDRKFVDDHPALHDYLQDHPGVRDEIKQNPDAFMHREDRIDTAQDARGRDVRMRELASFNQFLDGHRDVADQVRRDPSLLDNRDYVDSHPELRAYLQDHPGVRDDVRSNPDAFMHQEDRFGRDANDQRNPDAMRRDLADFNQFLDRHREIAEQLRRDPSLVDNHQFVDSHPALQAYLQQQPGVRDAITQNPDAFMRQEDRIEQADNGNGRYRDFDHGQLASFKGFWGDHPNIAADISKDPTLCKNQDYVKNHPELDAYLNANPGVRDQWTKDPQGFVKATQDFHGTAGASVNGTGNMSGNGTGNANGWSEGKTPNQTPNPTPAPDQKPKQ
jgi:hypothetical protein